MPSIRRRKLGKAERPGPLFSLTPFLPVYLTGMKYGCRGGGCSSCTVIVSRYNPETKKIHHYPVTACLVPICCLYGDAVTTVEGVGSIKTRIHPVQERLAKCHCTCGFCSPGMVMSVYMLLRNHPEPTPEQITEDLGGNLCRFTGHRPIVESGKTFCVESTVCQMKGSGKCCRDEEKSFANRQEKICTKLYSEDEFQPLDPAQEPLFPPELIRMAEDPNKRRLMFKERTTWIIPINSNDLLERKTNFPKVPLVMGNTAAGPSIKFKDEFHPVFISPVGLPELYFVDSTDDGVTIGVGYSLAQLNDALHFIVSEQPKEKTKTYHAPLQHLRTLAGAQIRSMATLGHVVSRPKSSDLNPILAAGNATINLISKEGERQIPLDSHFLKKSPEAGLKSEEVVLSVYIPRSTQHLDGCFQFMSALEDFTIETRQGIQMFQIAGAKEHSHLEL
ncbi:LOW QUALITY PROTEIN: aldehyde oxidase 4-like [Megaptera novaeangliae]